MPVPAGVGSLMENIMTPKTPEQLLHELRQFTGDLERYQSLSPRLIYTPGIQYLAQQAQCYWLIDAIASYVPSKKLERAIRQDPRIEVLHFWKLAVSDDQSAVLSARVDSGDLPFITQKVPYTDFPLECIDLWCAHDGHYWTLYLPSEN